MNVDNIRSIVGELQFHTVNKKAEFAILTNNHYGGDKKKFINISKKI